MTTDPASSTPARLPAVLAPSILSADLARLGEDTSAMLAAGTDWVHFDVMDNHYVPNLTFGPDICKALRNYGVTATIDVHLMVEPVDALAQAFAKAGANIVTFHPEATKHVERSLSAIRDAGCQAGLVFNPATSLSYLDWVLDKVDMVLLMSVNPGFGGQGFLPSSLAKLRATRARLDAYAAETGRQIRLEIDGGVKVDNIRAIAEAGADAFVAGSALFGAFNKDYKAVVDRMRAELAASGRW